MKKVLCFLFVLLFGCGMLACAGPYGLSESGFLNSADVIQLLSEEADLESDPAFIEATDTDENWESYLCAGLGDQKTADGKWLDDQIVTVLPKSLFFTLGTHAYIGREWGFYAHTTLYQTGIYTIDLFLFDIEVTNGSFLTSTITVDPVLEFQYRGIADCDEASDSEDPARVRKVDDKNGDLDRYFLTNVVVSANMESGNPRNLEIHSDFIDQFTMYFRGAVLGQSADKEVVTRIVPNQSTILADSMWRKQVIVEEGPPDHMQEINIHVSTSKSSHDHYFGGWLKSVSAAVYRCENIDFGGMTSASLSLNETYYPGQFTDENEPSPKEYSVGDIVPSALGFGMDDQARLQLRIERSGIFPGYADPVDFLNPSIEVSNEMTFSTQISMDVLYCSPDGKLVKMAEMSGEADYGRYSRFGETINLCQTHTVNVLSGGLSTDFRLYVESSGDYLLLNGGVEDSSEIFVFDSSRTQIAHLTSSSQEIHLEDSQLYYVIAKFQEESATGSYPISVWPN